MKIFVVAGTRPEAIKLAPVVAALKTQGHYHPVLVATSQHRELLRQALLPFGLTPDIDLDVMTAGQTPTHVASAILARIEPHLVNLRPAWTIVQGDTTSALAAAWASFHERIPVAHVEAGLRSGSMDAPFPEEFNRRALAVTASLHLAPTRRAARNLEREGVDPADIVVTGNTIVDAVAAIRGPGATAAEPSNPALILVTLHRRESIGLPARRVLRVLAELAAKHADRLRIVYPVHPNPAVDAPAREILGGIGNVDLVPPMDYPAFLALFARATVVVSDSGGVQEEAPCLGVPVLVLRDVTERPEAVETGWAKLVGTDPATIRMEIERILFEEGARSGMTAGPNPFGDGHAADRIVRAIHRRSSPGEAESSPAGAS